MKMSILCDAIFNELESQSGDFDSNALDVYKRVNDKFLLYYSERDVDKLERLSKKIKEVLVIIRLLPIEFKLGMSKCKYSSLLYDFIVVYINCKVALTNLNEKDDTIIADTIREVFVILGKDEEPNIWLIIAKSNLFNYLKYLDAFVNVSFEKIKKKKHSYLQYISMIYVGSKYLKTQETDDSNTMKTKKAIASKVLSFVPPEGIVKWLCHFFSGFGWKGLTDKEVHNKLVKEPLPKGFFEAVKDKIINGNEFDIEIKMSLSKDDKEPPLISIDNYGDVIQVLECKKSVDVEETSLDIVKDEEKCDIKQGIDDLKNSNDTKTILDKTLENSVVNNIDQSKEEKIETKEITNSDKEIKLNIEIKEKKIVNGETLINDNKEEIKRNNITKNNKRKSIEVNSTVNSVNEKTNSKSKKRKNSTNNSNKFDVFVKKFFKDVTKKNPVIVLKKFPVELYMNTDNQ